MLLKSLARSLTQVSRAPSIECHHWISVTASAGAVAHRPRLAARARLRNFMGTLLRIRKGEI